MKKHQRSVLCQSKYILLHNKASTTVDEKLLKLQKEIDELKLKSQLPKE
jgi:hypothetical protein